MSEDQNTEGQEQKPLPEYKCQKVVRALQIKSIEVNEDGGATITPVELDQGYKPFNVSPEYMDKHKPAPVGFFVVYEDGYQSFSPFAAFDKGYTKI